MEPNSVKSVYWEGDTSTAPNPVDETLVDHPCVFKGFVVGGENDATGNASNSYGFYDGDTDVAANMKVTWGGGGYQSYDCDTVSIEFPGLGLRMLDSLRIKIDSGSVLNNVTVFYQD